MRYANYSCRVWAAAALSFTTAAAGGAWALEPAPTAEVNRLVEQLASPRFKDRDAASKKLNAIGVSALPALRRAMQTGDTEMQRRAGELVAAIESRNASAMILAATKVRLNAKDVPLAQVLRDLSHQSNIRLFLAREPVDLGGRQVTLNTGETSFWEALDALCRQAKVHLRPAFHELLAQGAKGTGEELNTAGGEHQLILEDGAPVEYPTVYLGGVRMRLLPHNAAAGGAAGSKDRWIAEVLSEPKLKWQGPLALLWDEAKGGKGQRLAGLPVADAAPKPQDGGVARNFGRIGGAGRGVIVWQVNNGGFFGEEDQPASSGPQNVRLQEIPLKWSLPAEAQLGALRGRLKGIVVAKGVAVQTPDVRKAGDNAIPGKEGFNLTIRECQVAADGKVEMEIAVETPERPNAQQFGGLQLRLGGIGGGGGGKPNPAADKGQPVPNPGFHVWDHQGKAYQVTVLRLPANGKSGGVYRLKLTPPAKDSTPKKLEYHAPYPIGVEQPFTLKDIRLP